MTIKQTLIQEFYKKLKCPNCDISFINSKCIIIHCNFCHRNYMFVNGNLTELSE